MNDSPTGSPDVNSSLPTQPTADTQQPAPAETNQETNSPTPAPAEEVKQVPDTTTNQEQTQTPAPQPETKEEVQANGSGDDDKLAKFARSQGLDPDNMTDNERKLAKIAYDNHKAFRSKSNIDKITESKTSIDGDVSRDELESFRQEFRQYQSLKKAEEFFKQDGRDENLAPAMSEILEEKKAQYGPDYARVLSQDLNLLYDLAQIKQGGVQPPVDADAIRRQERESINQRMAATAPQAHATNGSHEAPSKIDMDWIRSKYDVNNPEHRALVDEYLTGNL